jgi:hypothetical protein
VKFFIIKSKRQEKFLLPSSRSEEDVCHPGPREPGAGGETEEGG